MRTTDSTLLAAMLREMARAILARELGSDMDEPIIRALAEEDEIGFVRAFEARYGCDPRDPTRREPVNG